jgi:uncharacterized OsmC-like protein
MTTQTQEIKMTNGVNVTQMNEVIEAVGGTPELAKFNFRATNQWKDGALNQTTINSFYGTKQDIDHEKAFILNCNEPKVLLGDDSAPNPVEYVLAGLVGCLTTTLVYHAAARGITIEKISSSIEGDLDLHGFLGLDPNVRKGFQNIRVKLDVKSDASQEELDDMATMSVVRDTITNAVPVNVIIEKK